MYFLILVQKAVNEAIYRGLHEKGIEDVFSAVCVQRDRYIVYIA